MVCRPPFVLALDPADGRGGPKPSRSFPEAPEAARLHLSPLGAMLRHFVLLPPACILRSHMCTWFILVAAAGAFADALQLGLFWSQVTENQIPTGISKGRMYWFV